VAKAEPQLYKPADACRMAEVAPYVLRYWETEFPALSEGKEKGSSRLYTARDVQIIARIRQLLYDEGFTVAGAKKRLDKAGIAYQPRILVGQIAESIVKHAKDKRCDLIYIGTRGMSELGKALVGSTATKVLHIAEIPVLLVK